jgi:hypothetical protein
MLHYRFIKEKGISRTSGPVPKEKGDVNEYTALHVF